MMAALEASVEAAKDARKRHQPPVRRRLPASPRRRRHAPRRPSRGPRSRLTPAAAKQPRYRPDYRAGLADIVRRRAGRRTFRQTLIFTLRPMCSADLSEVLSWYPSSTVRNPSRCSCSLTASVAPMQREHRRPTVCAMSVVKSLLLFVVAAVAEIGGAWLIWQACASVVGWSGSGRDRRARGVRVRGDVAGRRPLRADPRRLRGHLRGWLVGEAGVADELGCVRVWR